MPNLSEKETDELIVAQADDDEAWEEAILVHSAKDTTIALSAELAARAAFFAHIHKERNWQDWLKRVIEERIEIEEAAFAKAKRELAVR